MASIAIIILAAGGSVRLGSPKQLLGFEGRSLIRHAADTALATICRPVIAVLGAAAVQVCGELAGLDVLTIENPAWETGMGSSIRLGIEFLNTCAPDAGAVLLSLCDQPLVQPGDLERLIDAYGTQSRCSIAAASYNGTAGVPAILGRAHFDELRSLPDTHGAKHLLEMHRGHRIDVPLPAAAVDIDTREQYERLSPG